MVLFDISHIISYSLSFILCIYDFIPLLTLIIILYIVCGLTNNDSDNDNDGDDDNDSVPNLHHHHHFICQRTKYITEI